MSDEKELHDSILDAALDELDDDDDSSSSSSSSSIEENEKRKEIKKVQKTDKKKAEISVEERQFQEGIKMMEEMTKQFQSMMDVGTSNDESTFANDNEEAALFQQFLTEMQSCPLPPEFSNIFNFPPQNDEQSCSINSKSTVDEKVEELFQEMQKNSSTNEQNNMSNTEDENMFMSNLMSDFESMMQQDIQSTRDNSSNSGNIMEGMMKQMISKEIMYEPIKQITNKYPSWLSLQKDIISEKEYKDYQEQYKYFQQIVQIYEYDEQPLDYDKLLGLLEEVQEYGQPPRDIIKELAPDLDLDEDTGVPKQDLFSMMMMNHSNTDTSSQDPNNNQCPTM